MDKTQPRRQPPRNSGRLRPFTLIELLVVIAVIAVIASILIPALKKTMMTVRAVQCTNHTKQMAYAALMFADDNNDYLPTTGRFNVTWMVHMAPYLGCDRTFSSTHVNASGSPARFVEVFNCPETRGWPHNYYPSGDYGYNWNISTRTTGNAPACFKYVTPISKLKKPDQTILVGDCHIVTPEGYNDYIVTSVNPAYIRQRHHDFRLNIAFMDGHASLIGRGEGQRLTYNGVKFTTW